MDREALAGDLLHEILLRQDGGKYDRGVSALGSGTGGKKHRKQQPRKSRRCANHGILPFGEVSVRHSLQIPSS
jgi:hypothetical protein